MRAWTPTPCAGSGYRFGTWTGRSGTTSCAVSTPRPATVTVAIVGKYVDLPDAYLSVTEAVRAGVSRTTRGSTCAGCPPTSACRRGRRCAPARRRRRCAAYPGVSASAASRARSPRCGTPRRTASRPWACVSACSAWSSRRLAASPGWAAPTPPSSTRRLRTRSIATMADQIDVVAGERDMGGTMRLGLYPARLLPGSVAASAYGVLDITERHRHRYEVANAYRDALDRGRLRVRPGRLRTGGSSRSASWPARRTRSTWAPRRIRSSVQAHPRPPAVRGLHRCCRRARGVAAAGDGRGVTPGS